MGVFLHLSCDDGYDMFPEKYENPAVCQSDEKWSRVPKCYSKWAKSKFLSKHV